MSSLSIWHNIHFHKDVGPDATQIMGLPGTGKSQFANRIVKYCLEHRDDNFILSGDINCEWANVAPFAKKVTILTPHNVEIEDVNIPYDDQLYVRYNDLQIMDYFTNKSKSEIVIVYDEHLFGKLRAEKTRLWVRILQQLLYRKKLRRPHTMGLLFHEASILFPRQPVGDHWEAVMDFANLMVGARKNWVRIILIAQLEKHIINLIRDLCLWRIQRKGKISKMDNAKPLASSTPFLAMDEFNMSFGGIYRLQSKVEKLEEYNHNMQMIPVTPLEEYIEYYRPGKSHRSQYKDFDRNGVIKTLYSLTDEKGKHIFTQGRIGELFNIDRASVNRIIKDEKVKMA